MDFAAVRQYHGALIARGIYQWLLTGELRTLPPDGILEPPILEGMASLSYLAFGHEQLWVPRLASTMFWLAGAVFLYLIASKIASSTAAVISIFFYLFTPGTWLISRALMPEALMMMLLLASIFTILRYHGHPSMLKLLIAAAASSLALLVKPGFCIFQIFAVFLSLSIYSKGLIRSVISRHSVLFAVLSILPMALYYSYGTILNDFLQGSAGNRIAPEYIITADFWTGWLFQIETLVGYVAFAGALLGLLFALRDGLPRALMVGMWSGYLLFGLFFTFHIHTHDYYSLQFVPVVALSLGCLWNLGIDHLCHADWRYYRRGVVLSVLALALVLSALEHRRIISAYAQVGQDARAFPGVYIGHTLIANYEARARSYRDIGKVVDHSRHTVLLAPDFGYPLMYHGRLSGDILFPESDTLTSDFQTLRRANSPEYFIALKHFTHYHTSVHWTGGPPEYQASAQADEYRSLRRFISENFRVAAESKDYIVFDLR